VKQKTGWNTILHDSFHPRGGLFRLHHVGGYRE